MTVPVATEAPGPAPGAPASFTQRLKDVKLRAFVSALQEPLRLQPRVPAIAVLDDTIVAPLSLYLQATLLKDLSYSKWYRLSTIADVQGAVKAMLDEDVEKHGARSCAVVVICSNEVQMCDKLAALLHAMHDNCEHVEGRKIKVYLNFLPERRYAIVSRLLSYLGVHLKPGVVNGDQDACPATGTFGFGCVELNIRDLQVRMFPIDRQVLSLCQRGAHKRVHVDGDLFVLDNMFKAVLELLSVCDLSPAGTLLTAVGSDATCLGKRLHAALKSAAAVVVREPPQTNGSPLESVLPRFGLEANRRRRKFVDDLLELGAIEARKACGERLPSMVDPSSLTKAIHKLLLKDQEEIGVGEEENGTACAAVRQFLDAEIAFTASDFPKLEAEDELLRRVKNPRFAACFPDQATPPACSANEEPERPQLLSITVVDRTVDWVSPFVAPFTYEALLDLTWTVNATYVSVPQAVKEQAGATQPGDAETSYKLSLSGEDQLYTSIRDLPYTKLGPTLHASAVQLQTTYQRDKTTADWSVAKMQDFVSQLKQQQDEHRDLTEHLQVIGYLSHRLIKHPAFHVLLRVEDDIMSGNSSFDQTVDVLCGLCQRNGPPQDVYRLAIINDQVNVENYDRAKALQLKRALVRQYGLWEARRWDLLEQAGVLRVNDKQTGKTLSWHFLKNLTQELASEFAKTSSRQDDKDLSFVHSGYTPVSVALIQCLFEARRPLLAALMKQGDSNQVYSVRVEDTKKHAFTGRGLNLVVMTSGTTWSEICALRHMFKSLKATKGDFLVLAAEIHGYRSLLREFDEEKQCVGTPPSYVDQLKMCTV